MLESWDIYSLADAEAAGVRRPEDEKRNEAEFLDMWRYEKSVHEDWVNEIQNVYPGLHSVIIAAETVSGEEMAAFLIYMSVRLLEMRRVLKPTGSIYFHCDHASNSYLRLVLDAIFGTNCYQNEIVWKYGLGGSSPKRYSRKKDYLLFYSKSKDFYFDKPREASTSLMMGGKEKGMLDVWTDIATLNNMSKERTGYPTQKPVELAERIVTASCPEDGVVLDPFAGCAYVPVAAERNRRQWIACDISIRALTVLRRQFGKFDYVIEGDYERTGRLTGISEAEIVVRGPKKLPEGTNNDPDDAPELQPMPKRAFKVPASSIPEAEMKRILLEFSGFQAWCCGFANRMPDGTIRETTDNFHLDHIEPKAKRGCNEIMFRAPLCPAHNALKKDREITLERLRDEIEKAEGLMVNSRTDLIDLAEARHHAIEKDREWASR